MVRRRHLMVHQDKLLEVLPARFFYNYREPKTCRKRQTHHGNVNQTRKNWLKVWEIAWI
eukprot:m.311323 g.311323  ORF g.311323 m.311323 type:complete len:59 (-) comp20220_c0_seq9:898-1074(-)